MKKLFVVTGGAGFIGRNVVEALNQRGENNILIVDQLGSSEKWKNLIGLQYEDFLGIEEFRDLIFEEGLGEVEAIFHLGACSATTEKNADYLVDNNYRYTRDLCEWCLAKNTRFIYASSAATYGDGSLGYVDDDERTPKLKPLNMYGYSKQMFDLWALQNNLLDKIVGLKYFNVYGPYEDHKEDMRSVVHKAYGQILHTGKVKLFKSYLPEYEDGEQLRDFVYVKDAVKQTLWFYDHPEVSGLFNCGTGKARSWKDLVEATFQAMGKEEKIEFIEMPEILQKKYQYFTEAKMEKVRAKGFQETFLSLEDGVKDYVECHLSKLDWEK